MMFEGKAFLPGKLCQLLIKSAFDRLRYDDVANYSTLNTDQVMVVFGESLCELEER